MSFSCCCSVVNILFVLFFSTCCQRSWYSHSSGFAGFVAFRRDEPNAGHRPQNLHRTPLLLAIPYWHQLFYFQRVHNFFCNRCPFLNAFFRAIKSAKKQFPVQISEKH